MNGKELVLLADGDERRLDVASPLATSAHDARRHVRADARRRGRRAAHLDALLRSAVHHGHVRSQSGARAKRTSASPSACSRSGSNVSRASIDVTSTTTARAPASTIDAGPARVAARAELDGGVLRRRMPGLVRHSAVARRRECQCQQKQFMPGHVHPAPGRDTTERRDVGPGAHLIRTVPLRPRAERGAGGPRRHWLSPHTRGGALRACRVNRHAAAARQVQSRTPPTARPHVGARSRTRVGPPRRHRPAGRGGLPCTPAREHHQRWGTYRDPSGMSCVFTPNLLAGADRMWRPASQGRGAGPRTLTPSSPIRALPLRPRSANCARMCCPFVVASPHCNPTAEPVRLREPQGRHG